MDKAKQEICKYCKYFQSCQFEEDSTGCCHRYPPLPIYERDSIYPEVLETYWCGEWKKK